MMRLSGGSYSQNLPLGFQLYIMLAFFRTFQRDKSIEHYSSILVAFLVEFFSPQKIKIKIRLFLFV